MNILCDSDIFNKNLFEIHNFNPPEPSDLDPKNVCRWSEGRFSINHSDHVQNICLRFKSNFSKQLTVFISSRLKNSKHDYDLKPDTEYILYIPVTEKDHVSFFMEPTIPYQNGDIRKLGLYVRRIYTTTQEYESITLLDASVDSLAELSDNITNEKINEISVAEQKPNVVIYPFDYKKTNLHYNSCLFKLDGVKYLMTRKASFVLKNTLINTLNLFDFDTQKEIKLDIKDEVPYEQYEDPRVLVHNDLLYVICANYTHDYMNSIHQKILVFDKSFNHIRNIHPVYGNNSESIESNNAVEKNWTLFVHKDKLMCVYKMYPHTVVEFDWSGNMIAEYKSYFPVKKTWKYGECRGGSNPILHNGYYYSFFHSSIPWTTWKRRYFMGYYKFNSEPPFNIVEISNEPILWGNTKDVRDFPDTSPIVVFPCGSIIEENKHLISFGLNDERTCILTLDNLN